MGAFCADDIKIDKDAKKRLVKETIATHCTQSSPHEILRTIGLELQNGDTLIAEVLTGGLTNYSYQIFLEKSPANALFAKLAFPYALWNPDPDAFYDIKRTANEFKMMKSFSELAPNSVPAPLMCVEIDDMMLLVTHWSAADEQWANQFIDGVVDKR